VTPARFLRATFPLGGGRWAYVAQSPWGQLCQMCGNLRPIASDFQSYRMSFCVKGAGAFSFRKAS